MYTYIIYLTNNLSKAIFMKLRKLFSRITLSRIVVRPERLDHKCVKVKSNPSFAYLKKSRHYYN